MDKYAGRSAHKWNWTRRMQAFITMRIVNITMSDMPRFYGRSDSAPRESFFIVRTNRRKREGPCLGMHRLLPSSPLLWEDPFRKIPGPSPRTLPPGSRRPGCPLPQSRSADSPILDQKDFFAAKLSTRWKPILCMKSRIRKMKWSRVVTDSENEKRKNFVFPGN